ncbi:hypothetical protein H8959_005048 [Pygathrix nigripes]
MRRLSHNAFVLGAWTKCSQGPSGPDPLRMHPAVASLRQPLEQPPWLLQAKPPGLPAPPAVSGPASFQPTELLTRPQGSELPVSGLLAGHRQTCQAPAPPLRECRDPRDPRDPQGLPHAVGGRLAAPEAVPSVPRPCALPHRNLSWPRQTYDLSYSAPRHSVTAQGCAGIPSSVVLAQVGREAWIKARCPRASRCPGCSTAKGKGTAMTG